MGCNRQVGNGRCIVYVSQSSYYGKIHFSQTSNLVCHIICRQLLHPWAHSLHVHTSTDISSNGFSDVRIGVRIMFVTNTWEQVLQARIRPLYPSLWMLDNVLFGTII